MVYLAAVPAVTALTQITHHYSDWSWSEKDHSDEDREVFCLPQEKSQGQGVSLVDDMH